MTNKPTFCNAVEDYGRPPERQHLATQELVRPHIESFNFMIREGLSRAVQDIVPVEFQLENGNKISLSFAGAAVGSPVIAKNNIYGATLQVYPAECRERRTSYKGRLQVSIQWSVDGKMYGPEDRALGEIPIMVKSSICNLHNLSPAELIRRGEEAEEMGGYFIINGNEKIMRMLILPRRNCPLAQCRPSWKNRGPQYSQYGVSIRCVKPDQTANNMVLHYLNNGTATLSFTYNKEQFFVPVLMILKGLLSVTDQYIYRELLKGKEDNSFYKGCVANMLRQCQAEGLATQTSILKYIGERFRVKLQLPEWYTDVQIGQFLIKECICIHLDTDRDKFNLLVFMTRKLFSFSKGECAEESADNPMNQEILLGGHLYLMVLKEKLESWLTTLRLNIERKASQVGPQFQLTTSAFQEACTKASLDVGKSLDYLLATGNLVSKTGLGLMQASGLTVVADKLNYLRYLSHFRAVHRGAFFAEMRTTSVRKLLPEAWGFLCPVHTPDGSPCGLLNHLSAMCQVVTSIHPCPSMPRLLCNLGMVPYDAQPPCPHADCYPVMLDGKMLGWLPRDSAPSVTAQLRCMKVKGLEQVPFTMEICLVPKTAVASQYPGLYMFTGPARMIRPVTNLAFDTVEMIGSFEQVYMNICITPKEAHQGVTTHQELCEHSMLSVIANFTPFSDFNQSPRNMYQCQMGKQTMGHPLHAFPYRADNKLYRLQTPQCPIVRPYMHDYYNMDNYPTGTNAVVAVISYTGYDMEDAMILNKSSFERGFGHGTVIKSECVNLRNITREKGRLSVMFGCKPGNKITDGRLDSDGLPPIGTYLQQGDPFYSYINVQTGDMKIEYYKSQEAAYVDQIKVLGNDQGTDPLSHVCIVLRVPRNPIIGDKFASRHGQKGICSQKWPVENMPFTESGLTPDIVFNPHGFPSRMTIGMMIESMAGKSAAMHGLCHDATPFTFSEDYPAVDYFGQMLMAAGYNYYGTERMYSGVNGCELEVDIFFGIVYYQRLRHMVSDKFQVRTTGPIDQLTHQPVKGRKRGGGVRFGEMERDALLAHGTSFLLHDRLLLCSDSSIEQACTQCGSILSPLLEKPAASTAAASFEAARKWTCLECDRNDTVEKINMPYVFRYLVAELAAMNIKVKLDIRQ